jgi:hypothetical protein
MTAIDLAKSRVPHEFLRAPTSQQDRVSIERTAGDDPLYQRIELVVFEDDKAAAWPRTRRASLTKVFRWSTAT